MRSPFFFKLEIGPLHDAVFFERNIHDGEKENDHERAENYPVKAEHLKTADNREENQQRVNLDQLFVLFASKKLESSASRVVFEECIPK